MNGDTEQLIELMRRTATALTCVTASLPDELRALKTVRDAFDVAMCERLAELDDTAGYLSEDASSTSMWATRELRQDPVDTRVMVKAARTLVELPEVAVHAYAGRLSVKHLNRFTFSLAHVGVQETHALADKLLDIALSYEPTLLKQSVDHSRDTLHAEELDRAWLKGLDKQHISLVKTKTGYDLTGFLPIDVGNRLQQVLASFAVPRTEGDTRTAMTRKIEGLDQLLTKTLAEGLPTDGTVRPQVHVLVDAGTLKHALAPNPDSGFTPGEPATLVGFGHIGPNLLAHLTCDADLIPILVTDIEPNRKVLDVGRVHRYATAKQRHAIWVQQHGQCATDGCRNPIDHIHHEKPWSQGGNTNLDDMTGRCHRCHLHIHRHGNRRGLTRHNPWQQPLTPTTG